jgi:integrase
VLDRRAETPEASNDLRKAVATLFKWAVKRDLATDNPVIGTDKIRTYSEGHLAWGQKQIEQFIEAHPHGTKAYLALMLFLEAGQRRADVAGWGWQHVKDGFLVFVQQKNQKKLHKQMRIPITSELQDALDTVPAGQLTFLQTEFGKPHTVAGLGTWFRRRCDVAGLKGRMGFGRRCWFGSLRPTRLTRRCKPQPATGPRS